MGDFSRLIGRTCKIQYDGASLQWGVIEAVYLNDGIPYAVVNAESSMYIRLVRLIEVILAEKNMERLD